MILRSVYREPAAEQTLYLLLKERSEEDDPHVNISHRALPSWDEHVRFVRSIPYRAWYLIEIEGADIGLPRIFAGYVSLTRSNEIGIVLSRNWRGKGYGKEALIELISTHKPLPGLPSQRPAAFVANINPKNERSIRLFAGLGFRLKQYTYHLEEAAHGKDNAGTPAGPGGSSKDAGGQTETPT